MTPLQEIVEKLYDLSVGVIGAGAPRHERPHKPVMLLAVLDLIARERAGLTGSIGRRNCASDSGTISRRCGM